MNAHSPGPWYVGCQNDETYITAGERPALNNDYPRHDANRTAIAKVYGSDADAKLLAAAPDLAASCGEMLILLIALGLANAPTAPQRLAEYPQVIALRAALDKAGL